MATITCKISETLNAELEALARRQRVSKSALVREAVADKIRRAGKGRPVMAYDLVKHLRGTLHGPPDLSTNPKYMDDFGA